MTAAKQQKLVQSAQEYVQERGYEDREWRIDVVGIEAGRGTAAGAVDTECGGVEVGVGG